VSDQQRSLHNTISSIDSRIESLTDDSVRKDHFTRKLEDLNRGHEEWRTDTDRALARLTSNISRLENGRDAHSAHAETVGALEQQISDITAKLAAAEEQMTVLVSERDDAALTAKSAMDKLAERVDAVANAPKDTAYEAALEGLHASISALQEELASSKSSAADETEGLRTEVRDSHVDVAVWESSALHCHW